MKQKTKSMLFEKILLVLLILLQVADGVLTHRGVSLLGIEAEGNLLIKKSIEFFGLVPGIIIPKIVATSVLLFLWKSGEFKHIALKVLLIFTSLLYLIAAVGWVYILYFLM